MRWQRKLPTAPDRAGSERHLWRALGACYFASLVLCLTFAARQPVLSRVDEGAHVDVIAQYATGHWPAVLSSITPDTLALMRQTGTYGWNATIPVPRPPYDRPLPVPQHMSAQARVLWLTRHQWQFSYEAVQPPLYYGLAAPVWLVGRALFGDLGAVYALRVANALLAALLAPLAYLLALELWPNRRGAAFVGALGVGALPGILINLTQVTNDTLAAVLGAVALLLSVRALQSGATPPRALAIGALVGLGSATKLTDLGLLPAVAVALALAPPRNDAARRLALAGGAFVVCLAPWLVANLLRFGSLTQGSAFGPLATGIYTPGSAGFIVELLYALATLVAGEPISATLRPALPLLVAILLVIGLAAAGWLHALRSRRWSAARLVVVVAIISEVLLVCAIPALAGTQFNAPGRYAASVAGAMVVLVVAGAAKELRTRTRQVIAGTGLATCLVAALAIDFAQGLQPYLAAEPGPPRSLVIRAVQIQTVSDGLVIQVDRLAVDRTTHSLWLHLSAINTGSTYAEWSPLASATEGGSVVGTADARQAGQFALRIDPGGKTTGWLLIALAPQEPRGGDLRVGFDGVATSAYQKVSTAVLTVRA